MAPKITNPINRIKTGSYVGDGNPTKTITGVGFQPKFILLAPGGSYPLITKIIGMGLNSHIATGAFGTDRIISLDIDGFTVGITNGVNTLGQTNYYIAIREV